MNKSNMNRRDDRSNFSKSDKGGYKSSSAGSFPKKSYKSDSSFPRDKGFDQESKFNRKSSSGDSSFPQDGFKRSTRDSGFQSSSKPFGNSGKPYRSSGEGRNFNEGPKKDFKSGNGFEFKKRSDSGFSREGDRGGFNRGGEKNSFQPRHGGEDRRKPFSGRSDENRGSRSNFEFKKKSDSGFSGERESGGFKRFDDKPFFSRENRGEKKPYQGREGGDDRRNSFSGRSDDNRGSRSNFEFKKRSDSGFSGERESGGFKRHDDKPFFSRENRGEKKPYQGREGGDDRRNSFSGRSDDNRGSRSNFEFKKRSDSGFSGEGESGGFKRHDDKPFFSRENRGEKKPFHAREKGEERRNSFQGRSGDQNGNNGGFQLKRKPFGGEGFGRDDERGGFNRGGEKSGFSRESRVEKRPFQSREGGDDRRDGFKNRYNRDENRGSFDKGFSKPKSNPYKGGQTSATDGIRLNRFIANAGISSRREADELIQTGAISLNGEIVTAMGLKVMPGDEVRMNGALIKRQRNVYFLMNKPKDFITTMEDPQGRKTVMELMEDATTERIYPVGRLDRNTTGVLLFTNDGELTQKLTHPSFNIKKIYLAELDKKLTREDMKQIAEGVELEDGFIKADSIAYIDIADQRQIGIEIHSGRNRIIHRIFEHLGYKVEKLDRTSYAGLTKKDLKRGQYRELTKSELNQLYSMK